MKNKKFLGLGIAAICMLYFILPAQGASFKIGDMEWSLNGSLRMETSYQMLSRGDNATSTNLDLPPKADRNTFILETPGNSWLRATVKQDKLEAVVEFGLINEPHDLLRFMRHGYVAYDLGAGNKVIVGRTWSLLAEDGAYQRLGWDAGLWGAGDLFSFRHEQIQFSHKGDQFIFKVSIEDNLKVDAENKLKMAAGNSKPESENKEYALAQNFGLTKSYTTQDLFPALYANFSYLNGGFKITPSLFFQSYELKADEKNTKDVTVVSSAGALDASYRNKLIGISSEIWYGQNIYIHLAEANISEHNNFPFQRFRSSTIMGRPVANTTNDDINDVDSIGGWLQFAVFIDKKTVRLGGGYQQSDSGKTGINFEDKLHTWSVYTNLEYPLYKTFRVIPGIAYYNWGQDVDKNRFGTDKNDLGTDLFAGLFFQYDF